MQDFKYTVYHNKAEKCIQIYKDGDDRGYIAKLTHLKQMVRIVTCKSNNGRIDTGISVAERYANYHQLPIQIMFNAEHKYKQSDISPVIKKILVGWATIGIAAGVATVAGCLYLWLS